MIGDVSGKGAEAAAVTALARHTLRTAALHHDEPAANLAVLNRALLAERGTEFCTVVCARAAPRRRTARRGARHGGHPPPLVVRAGGGVERVERPRDARRRRPDPDFADATSAWAGRRCCCSTPTA